MSKRKTGWIAGGGQLADPGPWRQQAILGRRDWDADCSARYRPRLCHPSSWRMTTTVLVIDETGFLKQGKASCGVGGVNTRVPRAKIT